MIVTKLKKMASLASMLTKMIDETKTTILSPGRLPPAKARARQVSIGSHLDERAAQNCLQAGSKKPSSGEIKPLCLVSASYSLDLSGAEQASLAKMAETTPSISPPIASPKPMDGERKAPPSPSQVEGMYTSFLLSQNVSHVGSGYLSPTAPAPSRDETAASLNGHRSLASLFVVPSSPTFAHLLEKYGEHPKRQRKVSEASSLPRITTSSLGLATRSTSSSMTPVAPRSSQQVGAQHDLKDCSDRPVVRQSVALENATFEILNPARHTAGCTVALSTDDCNTIRSGSKYEMVDASSISKPDRVSVWTSYRQTKSERKIVSSSGGRSKLGRLFRLVS